MYPNVSIPFLFVFFSICFLLDDDLLGGGVRGTADVDGRPELAACLNGIVDGVDLEGLDEVGVDLLAVVDGGVGELLEDVVESRRPLPGAGLGGEGAVVHHECDAPVVHVGAEGVDGLDDGLVDDLGVWVAGLEEHVDLGHHGGDVYAGGEGVHGDVLLVAGGADLLSDDPGVGSVDLADGELVDAGAVHDDGADLVAGRDLVVDLLEDLLGGHVGGGVGLLEDLLVVVAEGLVHGLDALGGDDLDDVAGDGLAGLGEGLLGGHALPLVAAVEGLDNAVDGAEEDAALAVDVGLVLGGEGGLEHEGGSEGDSPAEGEVGGLAGLVLVDGEGGVDAGAVDLLALLVEAADGGSHALGADGDDVHVLREGLADGVEVSEEEAVGEAEGGAGLHGREDLLVQLGLGGVADQEHDKVGLLDHLPHLAKGAVLLAEAGILGLLVGSGGGAKADGDGGVGAGLHEGVAEVLGLGGGLGSPPDDADLLDALEGLGEEGEEVASALDDGLGGVGELDLNRGENVGGEGHLKRRGRRPLNERCRRGEGADRCGEEGGDGDG
mmetsp:Transcript_21569/g.43585  ORF Transcript_21569/g.43585 Transcript_21569/m.43585 type:complete len:552 (+) Transcript_21569:94-1749(+)